ncbi:hypothetical protein [Methylocystis rosea]|uniref:hypothetical protein n=1 Tax=Methylocystis rosea TaxID=173366 RepID=UPI003D2F1835
MRLEYAQFLELEMFTRFGGMLDERTRKVIEHGRRIRAVLSQQQFAPLPLGEQVALLLALSEGVLDGVSLDRVAVFRAKLGRWLMERCPEIAALDDRTEALRDELRTRLKASLEALAGSLGATGDPL